MLLAWVGLDFRFVPLYYQSTKPIFMLMNHYLLWKSLHRVLGNNGINVVLDETITGKSMTCHNTTQETI